MIDVHCHFDLFPNPIDVVNKCEKDKLITIGMTNLPSHFELGHPHLLNFKYVRLALGMHPLMATEGAKERNKFSSLLSRTSYIGEVGLDFSPEGFATKELQIKNFDFVLNSIKLDKKILSLHSRRAERVVLQKLQDNNIENAIFHWFSGDLSTLREILKAGYFFSINPAMIKSPNGQKIIEAIPLDRILTETDAPFTQFNNRDTVPEDVKYVINHLAQLHDLPFEKISKIVDYNFKLIIGRIR